MSIVNEIGEGGKQKLTKKKREKKRVKSCLSKFESHYCCRFPCSCCIVSSLKSKKKEKRTTTTTTSKSDLTKLDTMKKSAPAVPNPDGSASRAPSEFEEVLDNLPNTATLAVTTSLERIDDRILGFPSSNQPPPVLPPPPPPPPPPVVPTSNLENHSIHHGSLNGSQTYSFAHRKNLGPRRRSFIGLDSCKYSSNLVEDPALCAVLLTIISLALIVVSLPFSLFFCIKVVQEYERAVIFRLGRLVTGGARGPGIFFIIPCIDTYSKVDLRTVSFDVPPQEILSKDSVTVAVDAVVYFRINNAIASVSNVEDYARSTRLLAATTLRNVLGTKNLSEILSERESISHMIQSSLDEATESWGVKVERVEIKDVRLPVLLQRAMAAEAEATREARAKVIAAEGEQRASRALKEAAEVIADSPAALQLRYLQTLSSIAAENNSTIVFPVPLELFRGFIHHNNNNSHKVLPFVPSPNTPRKPSIMDWSLKKLVPSPTTSVAKKRKEPPSKET